MVIVLRINPTKIFSLHSHIYSQSNVPKLPSLALFRYRSVHGRIPWKMKRHSQSSIYQNDSNLLHSFSPNLPLLPPKIRQKNYVANYFILPPFLVFLEN